jgi:peptide/nickel transport system permease protein
MTRRFLYMLVNFAVISLIAFVVIQLPPGDFVDYLEMRNVGYESRPLSEEEIAALRHMYGLDRPIYVQYLFWVGNFVRGRLGVSFLWEEPIARLIAERLPYTIVVAFSTLFFTYLVSLAIGVYSATHQYSLGDYVATVFGFVGLAIPNFLFALVLMVLIQKAFGVSLIGLFSSEYADAPWSFAKLADFLMHLWVPIVVIGTAGTAAVIRILRASMLDELKKQYVIVARAKGLGEGRLIFKYPVRVALNPVITTFGIQLPQAISGTAITAIVLNLPTLGPLLLSALTNQDMYLAGAIIMLTSALVLLGAFVSDLLLAVNDPRIRFD